MQTVDRVLAHLDSDRAAAVARLDALLRIPSVSAQPAHAPDCRRAAEHLRADLAGLGFDATVIDTDGHPVVLAHHPGPPGGALPRVLVYGHYDVQPAEPFELWHSPPFEPAIIEGPHGQRIVARGAVDDKGQVAMILEAFRAWNASGGIPVPMTVLIEGEEEVGSVNLDPFLQAHADRLAADFVLVSDTGMWDIDTPAITASLRGLAYMEVTLHGPDKDLHSGIYGGAALNPINALTRILGALHDEAGRVQLPGFYDRVRETSPEQAAAWNALGFDERGFLDQIGLSEPVGERGRSALERLWARPTADINGIVGGYTGQGAKTVIAAHATAKVSFRLVADQDPEEIRAAFERFVTERLPPGARAEFQCFGLARAVSVPTDLPAVAAARAALRDEYRREPVLIGGGGSIPVVESFQRILGLPTLLMGFGLGDDQVHSPNEKFELRCFHQGARAHARLLARLADPAGRS